MPIFPSARKQAPQAWCQPRKELLVLGSWYLAMEIKRTSIHKHPGREVEDDDDIFHGLHGLSTQELRSDCHQLSRNNQGHVTAAKTFQPTQVARQFFKGIPLHGSIPKPEVKMEKDGLDSELPGYCGARVADGLILGGGKKKPANWCREHEPRRRMSHFSGDSSGCSIHYSPQEGLASLWGCHGLGALSPQHGPTTQACLLIAIATGKFPAKCHGITEMGIGNRSASYVWGRSEDGELYKGQHWQGGNRSPFLAITEVSPLRSMSATHSTPHLWQVSPEPIVWLTRTLRSHGNHHSDGSSKQSSCLSLWKLEL